MSNLPDGHQLGPANWAVQKDALMGIRKTVFVDEQKVPESLEWDEYDNTAQHFYYSINNQTVATGRLKTDGQIGRMAVLAEYRNQGIGQRLLHYILQYARQQHRHVFLHAQVAVSDFYKKAGFVEEGEVFMDAGIAHITMKKKL